MGDILDITFIVQLILPIKQKPNLQQQSFNSESDFNSTMAASIHETCENILTNIRGCELNYYCQETPYSIYLTIRKSWSRHHNPVKHLTEQKQSLEIGSLGTDCENMRAELESLKATKSETINSLNDELKTLTEEKKRTQRETEEIILKKDDEINALKNSSRAQTLDTEKLVTELNSLKKLLKGKDKEIHDLQKYKTNHQETLKSIKSETKELKSEKNKLLKQVTILENKNKDLKKQKPFTENNNNNKLDPTYPSLSSSLVSTLDSASSPSTTRSASTTRNNSSPAPTPLLTLASLPHTPPGAPPSRRSQSKSGACEIPPLTSTSTDSISQTPSPAFASAQITDDYIVGINQINLGPRVNDLSKMFGT